MLAEFLISTTAQRPLPVHLGSGNQNIVVDEPDVRIGEHTVIIYIGISTILDLDGGGRLIPVCLLAAACFLVHPPPLDIVINATMGAGSYCLCQMPFDGLGRHWSEISQIITGYLSLLAYDNYF